MHVDEAAAAGPLVQIVDVLRHDEQVVAQLVLQPGERVMRGVGDDGCQGPASRVVEAEHQLGVGLVALRRRDAVDGVSLPQSVGGAEGRHSALGGDAGTGQHDDPHGTIVT